MLKKKRSIINKGYNYEEMREHEWTWLRPFYLELVNFKLQNKRTIQQFYLL